MFSGTQELLLIIVLIVGLFIIPRMMKPRVTNPVPPQRRPALRLSRSFRLAIVLSIIWPLACALYFKPWQQDGITFAIAGLGPVVLGWSLKWVMAGVKNRR